MTRRRVEPAAALDALQGAWAATRDWLDQLTDDDLSAPSVLAGWTVRDLVAHVALGLGPLTHAEVVAPSRTEPPLDIDEWLRGYADRAPVIARTTTTLAAERTADDLRALLDERWAAALAAVEEHTRGTADPVLLLRGQRIRLGDLLVTRLIEVVVHGDDLVRSSVPSLVGAPDVPAAALRLVTRTLLEVLAARAPGRSVEVRVPPYAAVQAVPGPRHTRGTPPGVVEAAPIVWLRLAAGRTDWADAVGTPDLTASGERADLSPYLPLL